MFDVVFIFLNYLLNKRLEKTTPLNPGKALDPDYHYHPYRDSIIAARTLKTTLTMIVPAFLTIVQLITDTDENILRDYLILNFTVYTIINIIKLSTSRPRPYAKDAETKGLKWNGYFESRKSFLSGHACNGLISGIAVARFLIPALSLHGILALVVQGMVLAIAAIPGITQGICKWHHWTDVGCGYLLAIAYYAAYHRIIIPSIRN
jgi:membrane-associated phospholipid phosphatase